jgi:membrane associated rhomboid family serine protease
MIPLRDNAPIHSLPFATWGLIALNAVVFLYELTMPDPVLEQFFMQYALVPGRLAQGDNILTPLTCMFLHGGWLHIIGNMWSLYLFGDNVEDRLGSGRFVLFYLFSGIAANLTHFVTQSDSMVPTLGASGAIAGVMGAYVVLFPRARVLTLVPIFIFIYIVEVPAVVFLGLWFVMQLLSGLLSASDKVAFDGVAWWAHIGGFATGILTLPLFLPSSKRRPEIMQDDWPLADEDSYHTW